MIERITDALVAERAARLEAGGDRANCIGSTKIALEVFAHFGIDAKAVPVDVVILNASYVHAVEAGTLLPGDRSTWPDDAWSLGLGFWKPGDPAGHLVVLADDVLIDLTLDQASRPEHNINLEPMAVEIDRVRFDAGDSQGPSMSSVGGVYVGYRRAPEPTQWWTTSPNWGRRDAPLRREIVAKIIRSLRSG